MSVMALHKHRARDKERRRLKRQRKVVIRRAPTTENGESVTDGLLTVDYPDKPSSPAEPLLRLVPLVLLNIAPERRREILDFTTGLRLSIVEDDKDVCHYIRDERTIVLSCRTIEDLWVFSYSALVVHDIFFAGRDASQAISVDLHSNARVSNAISLLEWSTARQSKGVSISWLPEVPRPGSKLAKSSLVYAADELTLSALGFLLWHELMHAKLGHEPLGAGLRSIEQEREADAGAVAWILDKVSSNPLKRRQLRKRGYAILMALLQMVTSGVHTGYHGGATHPFHFVRLIDTLAPYFKDPNHPVWSFATAVMSLHMSNSPFQRPSHVYESFREGLDAYIELLMDEATAPPP